MGVIEDSIEHVLGHLDGSLPVIVLDGGVSSALQQLHQHALPLALHGRQHVQGSVAMGPPHVHHVGMMLQQERADFFLVLLDGNVQRPVTVLVLGKQVSSSLQEDHHDTQMPLTARVMERRQPVLVSHIGVELLVQQLVDFVFLPMHRSVVEPRRALIVPGLVLFLILARFCSVSIQVCIISSLTFSLLVSSSSLVALVLKSLLPRIDLFQVFQGFGLVVHVSIQTSRYPSLPPSLSLDLHFRRSVDLFSNFHPRFSLLLLLRGICQLLLPQLLSSSLVLDLSQETWTLLACLEGHPDHFVLQQQHLHLDLPWKLLRVIKRLPDPIGLGERQLVDLEGERSHVVVLSYQILIEALQS
mmetsp:Transcript_34792/g.108901  ORF Transcript_34792/g.108901 Transcript_34792/m.108901 type:complete len:357 (-) Transcript_34792:249-1319(-)